jgi:iron transport multicopper oxidase
MLAIISWFQKEGPANKVCRLVDRRQTGLLVTEVEAGKTYRLRLINLAQLVMMNFTITNHTLAIVQVQGTSANTLTVESIDVSPGQRYDVLITMDQAPGRSYLIEACHFAVCRI